MRGRLLVAAGVLWALAEWAALAYPASACAQDAPAIVQRRDRQDAFVGMYYNTRVCLRGAGVAMLRQGVSEPRYVQLFMATECGDGLRLFLQDDGMPEPEARAYVARLARTAYYQDVLRVPEPPPHPQPKKD